MTLKEQYQVYLEQISSRNRRPVKGATLAAYQSYWRNWIEPVLGDFEVSAVENGAMKKLVSKITASRMSASSIAGVTNTVKGIVSSAMDENGNELFPRKWNSEFIDQPIVDPKAQKTPVLSAQNVTTAIQTASSTYAPLLALLAASGLRINEALALQIGPNPTESYWDALNAKLVIRTALYRGVSQAPKTAAGVREVDLDPSLNAYLVRANLPARGTMFPFPARTLYNALEKMGVPGFHSFRRFRITHLENVGVPRGLVMFWTGHAGRDVHDGYVKLGKENEARKTWAFKAGLNFELPTRQATDAEVVEVEIQALAS